MNSVETFPVPIRVYADPDIRTLMLEHDGMAALGRWIALLGLLYDFDGCVKLSDINRAVMCDTLKLDDAGLSAFLASCAERGFVDAVMLGKGSVVSRGVQKQIEYINGKKEAGRKGGKDGKRGSDGRP